MTHVLLVEPNARTAAIYRKTLHILGGHEVATAPTAQDAILAADAVMPDVVVLELQLTGHSGIEFLYEFRSYTDWRAVPVVVVSGIPPAEFEASKQLLFERLGVTAYHYKPRTSLQVLVRAVERALA